MAGRGSACGRTTTRSRPASRAPAAGYRRGGARRAAGGGPARARGREYAETLVLDHYLEVLRRKPGALPGATTLARPRAAGTITAAHQAYWDAARRKHGDAAGTRALIEVLLAHRALPAAAMTTAVSSGVLDPQVIVIEARARPAGRPPR